MEASQEAQKLQSPLLQPAPYPEHLSDSPRLRFPRLYIDQAVHQLSSDEASLAMRPLLSRQHSDAASSVSASSSLGDSTYDIVNLTDGESEDGNRSESLASVDGDTESTLDDTSIVTSPYNSDGEDSDAEDEEADGLPLDTDQDTIMNVEPRVDDSGYTARPLSSRNSPAASIAYLDFHVNEDPFDDDVGEHAINIVSEIEDLHEPSTLRELSVYNSSHVGLSLHMAVKRDVQLVTTRFRLLVVAYHKHFTPEIVEHVRKTLLVAHPYNSPPELDLVLLQCTGSDREHGAYQLDIEGQPMPILVAGSHMYMKDSEYSLPDLAVFLHPSLADVPAHSMDDVERHYVLVRHAMRACQVPVWDLSEHAPLFRAAPYSFTQTIGSMHLRVSTLVSADQSARVVDMLPVDLDKFLRIEPRTVNAHLTYIMSENKQIGDSPSLHSTNKVETSMDVVRAWCRQRRELRAERRRYFADHKAVCRARITESKKRIVDAWRGMAAQKRAMAITAMLTVIISLLYSSFSSTQYIKLIDSNASLSSEANRPNCNTPSAVSWLSETLFKATASVNTATSVMKAMRPDSTASPSSSKTFVFRESTEPEKKVETGLSKTPEKSVGQHFSSKATAIDESVPVFNIDVVDGNHIVLKPNRTSMFGHPLLRATVARNEEVIKTEVKPGSDGCFTIEMQREDAYGLLNVTIRWGPGYSQTAEVDMGSVWLKASTWGGAISKVKEIVKEDFAVAHANTRAISVRVATGISKFTKAVKDTEKKNASKSTIWKSITDAAISRKDLQALENSIPVRLGKVFGGAHATALTKWYDAVDTIRSVDMKQALLEKPIHIFTRGRENGKDLSKVIGGHASNIWKGCFKESTAGWRCGLACLNARAEACARRKAEESAARKNTGPRTIGEKGSAAKKARSKAKVS
jgi:hypothetical protein